MLKQVTDRPEKARQGQPQEQKEDQVIEEADPSPPVVRHELCPKAQVFGQGQEAAHLLVDGKVDVGLVLAPIDGFDLNVHSMRKYDHNIQPIGGVYQE